MINLQKLFTVLLLIDCIFIAGDNYYYEALLFAPVLMLAFIILAICLLIKETK